MRSRPLIATLAALAALILLPSAASAKVDVFKDADWFWDASLSGTQTIEWSGEETLTDKYGCGLFSVSKGSGAFGFSFASKRPRRFAAIYRDGGGREFAGYWLAGYGRHLAFEVMSGAETWKMPAEVSLSGSWERHDTSCIGGKEVAPEIAATSGCGSPRVEADVAMDGGNGGRIRAHIIPFGAAVLWPHQLFPKCPSIRSVTDAYLPFYAAGECEHRPGYDHGAVEEEGTLHSALPYKPRKLLEPKGRTYVLKGKTPFSCAMKDDSSGNETIGHDELQITGIYRYKLTLHLRRGHGHG